MKNKAVILLLLTLAACIDPLDYSTDKEEKLLVIEGGITTETGPHRVSISLSARYGTFFDGLIQRVLGAQVNIRDSEGYITELFEVGSGVYETPADFRAEVGKSYSLQIRTQGGKSYFSIPEEAIAAPTIDTLYATYKRLPSAEENRFRSGAEIWSRFNDPEDERNYYMWTHDGTYVIITHPENYVEPVFNTPAPKPCCGKCWITEPPSDAISILTDFNFNGNTVDWPVAFIEDDGGRFMQKYKLNVKQESLTPEAYQFFKLLKDQLSISGNIFDPPPATVRSNLINIDEPDEPIIGYFKVSDVSRYTIYVEPSVLDERQRLREINDDCRILPKATTAQPPDWEE